MSLALICGTSGNTNLHFRLIFKEGKITFTSPFENYLQKESGPFQLDLDQQLRMEAFLVVLLLVLMHFFVFEACLDVGLIFICVYQIREEFLVRRSTGRFGLEHADLLSDEEYPRYQ